MKLFLRTVVSALGLTMIFVEASTNFYLATKVHEKIILVLMAIFLGLFFLYAADLASKHFKKGSVIASIVASIMAICGFIYTSVYVVSFLANFAENYSVEQKKESPLSAVRQVEINELLSKRGVLVNIPKIPVIIDNSEKLSNNIAIAEKNIQVLCAKLKKWIERKDCVIQQKYLITEAKNGLVAINISKAEKENLMRNYQSEKDKQSQYELARQKRLDVLLADINREKNTVVAMPQFRVFADTNINLALQRGFFVFVGFVVVLVIILGHYVLDFKKPKRAKNKSNQGLEIESVNQLQATSNSGNSIFNRLALFNSEKDMLDAPKPTLIADLLAKKDKCLLLVGRRGAGKTSALAIIASALAKSLDCDIIILDPSYTNDRWDEFDNVRIIKCGVSTENGNKKLDYTQIGNALLYLDSLITERYIERQNGVVNHKDVFVICDEFNGISANFKSCGDILSRMLRSGREVNVNPILGAHSATANGLGIVGNFKGLIACFDAILNLSENESRDKILDYIRGDVSIQYNHPGRFIQTRPPKELQIDDLDSNIQNPNTQESNVQAEIQELSVPAPVPEMPNNVYSFSVNKAKKDASKSQEHVLKDASLLSKDADTKGRAKTPPTLDEFRLAIKDGSYFDHEDSVGTRPLWRFSKVISPRQGIGKDTAAKYVIEIKKDGLPLTKEEWTRLNPDKAICKEVG